MRVRHVKLSVFGAKYGAIGTVCGDLNKGGRRGTAEELARLRSWQTDGRPKGLIQCVSCREWRGECLNPNPIFRGWIMPVSCLCERCRQGRVRCRHALEDAISNENIARAGRICT